MSTTLRVQVTFANDTNIPRDVAINTWHFISLGLDPGVDAGNAFTQLADFYGALEDFYSTSISGVGTLKAYDLVAPEPRTPILESDFSFGPGTAERFPDEVAIAFSYNAAGLSGASPLRRRGRIFLGPLNVTTGSGGTGEVFVTSDFIDAACVAGGNLISAGVESNSVWAVFSPTTAGPPDWDSTALALATHPVTRGHIDNAFDTVRSRGHDANFRRGFTVAGPD